MSYVHGITSRSKADAYAAFLEQRAIPDYHSIPGNLSVVVLRRDEAAVSHFMTVPYWESEASIRGFAGDDLFAAKYYPEDREFPLEFELHVKHFTVAARQGAA